jgi:hypothetical protein
MSKSAVACLVVILVVVAATLTGVFVSSALLASTIAPTLTPTALTGTATNEPTTNTPTLGPTSFEIQLSLLTTMTGADSDAFIAAKSEWERIVTEELVSATYIPQGESICGLAPAPSDVPIKDLLIYAQVMPIDGVGGILGQAGPCGILDNHVRVGLIQLDSADLDALSQEGLLKSVILHEMGHVLGIGTMWDAWNLIDPSSVTTNIRYYGTQGDIGNTEIGGVGDAVVEDTGGSGTARSHWKESVYHTELMTGYLDGTTQPLSRLTARSLADLGYSVNASLADPFTITTGRRRLRSNPRRHVNDTLTFNQVQLPRVPKVRG